MYSKAEKSTVKKEFWTTFGLYMKPMRNAEGESINWVNYKTGIKNIFFRMDADSKKCTVAIELKHPSDAERNEVFEKFNHIKKIFGQTCGQDWDWIKGMYDDDHTLISKIYTEKTGVNIMSRNDWPQIISFLKEKIIKLDEFWLTVKANFD